MLLLVPALTLSVSADNYLYLRTGEVKVGFETMLGFGLSIQKVDTMCDGGKCYEIPKSFERVDEYNAKDKRCFIHFSGGITGSLSKPDFFMGDEKVTGNPKYITFLCKRMDIASDAATNAEEKYNRCMSERNAEPSHASAAVKILGEALILAKQGLAREEVIKQLQKHYEMADIDASFKWYTAHQICFPQAYPNPEKFAH